MNGPSVRRRQPDKSFSQFAAVPAYFGPGSNWSRMLEARTSVAMLILNIDSGPGRQRERELANQVALLQEIGVTVLGYVDTAHSTRPHAVVRANIHRYRQWYGIGGVFLDQTHVPVPVVESYYRPLYERLKAEWATSVVVNAGEAMPEEIMTAADVLVDFESDYEAYLGWSQPAWTKRYLPERFWHIVHSVRKLRDIDRVLELSRQRGVGWLYATDQSENNVSGNHHLYDRLPRARHWERLQDGLASHLPAWSPRMVHPSGYSA